MRTRERKHPVHGRFCGFPVTSWLTDAEFAAFQRALNVDGFVTVTPRTLEAKPAWYHWCEAHGWPAVVVEHRQHGRAEVILDTITAARGMIDGDSETVRALFREAGPRSGCWGGEYSFATFGRESAERLAREFLRVVRGRRPENRTTQEAHA